MQQIVDLQTNAQFQALNVAVVSIATDSRAELDAVAQAYDVAVPMLSDTDEEVSQAYDVLQWAAATGEPGHTFVLVDTDGTIRWIKDYGAPANGGLMYVPVNELTAAIAQQLGSS